MKKSILIVGLIPIILFVIGIISNVANPLQRIGDPYLWMSCMCLPPAVAFCFFELKVKPEKVKSIAAYSGVISIGHLAFAVLFKKLHIPGADFLIIIGISVFVIFLLPFLFRSMLLKD
jgi:hypothetical protein